MSETNPQFVVGFTWIGGGDAETTPNTSLSDYGRPICACSTNECLSDIILICMNLP